MIESIIDSRKSVIIENVYTNLAQTSSPSLRSFHNVPRTSVKPHPIRPRTVNQVHFNDKSNQIINSDDNQKLTSASTIQFDNDQWDDGLNGDIDKGKNLNFTKKKKISFLLESIASKDKSSLQIYEETCKRLKICPSSMIIRSLYTTNINLENYGLGVKGSQALAVALVVNYFLKKKNVYLENLRSFFFA